MLIERGQSWFTELLRLSLLESRELQINPRNCIGTVLALNGHRKYFCMYHAKHPETIRGKKVSKPIIYSSLSLSVSGANGWCGGNLIHVSRHHISATN